MKSEEFKKIERYMLDCMKDSAHDCLHVYRVLYLALDISKEERNIDEDVLIVACLLHDIGRNEQLANPLVCHAEAGAQRAYEILIEYGWPPTKAMHVRNCILTHRFSSCSLPQSIEAKILFDADKLEAAGAIGVARCLVYEGLISEPLYSVDAVGYVLGERESLEPSFIREYNRKLKTVYENFYTQKAKDIAVQRQEAAINFYNSLLQEASTTHDTGLKRLAEILE